MLPAVRIWKLLAVYIHFQQVAELKDNGVEPIDISYYWLLAFLHFVCLYCIHTPTQPFIYISSIPLSASNKFQGTQQAGE